MENILNYKGYLGTIETSVSDDVLYGKIIGINDLVTYEADSIKELKKEFKFAVTDYLQTCKELGKEPNKFYKGVFNVRTSTDLHRALAVIAQKKKMKLNEVANKALTYLVKNESEVLN